MTFYKLYAPVGLGGEISVFFLFFYFVRIAYKGNLPINDDSVGGSAYG
jgi:hypothetical protein